MRSFFTMRALIIIALAVIISARFLWIDRLPPGMQHDEIEYVLSSKTYQMFDTDLSGVTFPESLIKTRTHGAISPIPPLFFSPIWNIFPMNMMTVRIAYLLLNVATALILARFVWALFKNRALSIITLFLFLLNPWSLFFSRQAIDAVFALFFFLLGITILIERRRYALIASYIFLLLGFFSYNGAKLLFVPVAMMSTMYAYRKEFFIKKRNLSKPFIFLISIGLTLGVFILTSKLTPDSVYSSRSTEISFLNEPYLADKVNDLRKGSISSSLNILFINKATVALLTLIQGYFGALSFQQLFVVGENFAYHGYFYAFELLFIFIGGGALFIKKRSAFYFIMSLVIVAPMITASSLNGVSILNRSFMLLPLFVILTAFGIYALYQKLSQRVNKVTLIGIFSLIYAVSFANLSFTYFYQVPIHENGFYQVSTRVLASYILKESSNDKKVVVISKEPRQLYLETVFFMSRDDQEKQLETKQAEENMTKYTINNSIEFVTGCPAKLATKKIIIVSRDFPDCASKLKSSFLIIDQVDAGVDYRIISGNFCKPYALSRWRGIHKVSDYAIEALSNQEFCERWIALPLTNE